MVKLADSSNFSNSIQNFFRKLRSSSEVRDATAQAFLNNVNNNQSLGKVSQDVVQSKQESTLKEGGPLTSNNAPQSLGFTVIDSNEDANDLSSDRVKVNKKLEGFKTGLALGFRSAILGASIFVSGGASLSLAVCLMPPLFFSGLYVGYKDGCEFVESSNSEFYSNLRRSQVNAGNDN